MTDCLYPFENVEKSNTAPENVLENLLKTLTLEELLLKKPLILPLKTNDGYIAASLKIEQNLGACHHLFNCFDIISGDDQIQ